MAGDKVLVAPPSAAGPRYTVTRRDGTVLAEGLTPEALQSSHPKLHRVLERAQAGPSLDARVAPHVRAGPR